MVAGAQCFGPLGKCSPIAKFRRLASTELLDDATVGDVLSFGWDEN
jgi:hypothetical protein